MKLNEILIAVMAVISLLLAFPFAPYYWRYKLWLLDKFGYWYVAEPILLAVFVNVLICIWLVPFFMVMAIPLDLILLGSAIYAYFEVKNYKKHKTESQSN